ncbi:hypothetical protein HYW21_02635 [Candidatus Woesearchaeota archaeon]|nr:hypothetical protein [Candidatus Woesearchaeota archaeon]
MEDENKSQEQEKELHETDHHTEKHHHHHQHEHTAKDNSLYTKMYWGLGIALIVFALINLFQINAFGGAIDQRLTELKEEMRAPEIEVTIVSVSSCPECYDITTVTALLESAGANITKQRTFDYNTTEGQAIVETYSLTKLPTAIISGELNKSSSLLATLTNVGEEKKGSYVFTALRPPYVETNNYQVRGKISLVHLRKTNCTECYDLSPIIREYSTLGLVFADQEVVDADSGRGQTLIDRYNITKLPTVILDKEAGVYSDFVSLWPQVGSIEEDGSLVMRLIGIPYYGVSEQRVKGQVSVFFLQDETCTECYNPITFHLPVLQRMNLALSKQEMINASSTEGQKFITDYKIEKLPTIIMQGDMQEYPTLVRAWQSVGSIEEDGSYVFRSVEIAQQPYKDVVNSAVVNS